jgi:hypothetical protein
MVGDIRYVPRFGGLIGENDIDSFLSSSGVESPKLTAAALATLQILIMAHYCQHPPRKRKL